MKKPLAIFRVQNAEELLTSVGNMIGARASEILSDQPYRITVYEELLSDKSKTLNFSICAETRDETKRER